MGDKWFTENKKNAEGHTAKIIVTFRNFAYKPKKLSFFWGGGCICLIIKIQVIL
jgi:hypothetical protein